MKELNFSPGTAVEVNIDPSNSCDVWFPAKFIKQAAYNSFLVEYQSTRESGLQKVAVDSLHIRPSPPSSSNKAFNLLEKVDAFYDFRWLSGVVTKILADGRYIVYFKRTKKEKELSHSDLRLHMEWTNGKWVHYSQDSSTPSNSEKKLEHAVNGNGDYKEKNCVPPRSTGVVKENVREERISALTLKSFQEAGSEKADCKSTMCSNKRIKQASVHGETIYLKPSKRLNEKTASDVVLSPEVCKSVTKKNEGSNNGTSADLDTPIPSIPAKSSLIQSEDSNQPSASTEYKGDDEKHPVTRRRGRPRKQQPLVPEPADETPIQYNVVSPLGSIVLGLTHDGKMNYSLAGSSDQCMKEEHQKTVDEEERDCDTSANPESAVNNQKDSEVPNLKRKRGRGRPPKVLFRLGSPKPKEAEFVENKDAVSDAKDTPESHSPTNEVEKPVAVVEPVGMSDSTPPSADSRKKSVRIITDQIERLSDISKLNAIRRSSSKPRKVPKEALMENINELVRPVRQKRGKKHRSYKQIEPLIEDVVDDLREGAAEVFNNGVAKDVETVVVGTSSTVSDDDRPLSAWFEGTHSPPRADGRVPLAGAGSQYGETGERQDQNKLQPGGQPNDKAQEKRDEETPENVGQDNNTLERLDEMPTQSTAIVPMNNQQDLPFVKNSLIWEMLESMEVLKRIPQKPHFRPLYNCKEECREGLAIGNMVTFTSLVEKVSRLRFDDPKSLIDGYLEALVDLEELGFNVAPVREQLNALLSIKGKYEQAHNTSKEIESQIIERSNEKSKIDEEIAELDKKIAELNEKRALVVSKKELKDAEIELLQSSVDAVKGSLENAEAEFEKVTSSLW